MAKSKTPGAGEMTCAEAGHKGGSTTSARHGQAFYKAIGAKGGAVTKTKGRAYYEALGKLGGARMRALVVAGKTREGR